MKIDPAGIPFVVAAAVPAVALAAFQAFVWSAPFIVVAIAMALFFRDPDRQPLATGPNLVVSPADGRVMVAGAPQPAAAPDAGAWQQISIFLNPLDVHVNRLPVTGRVSKVDYRKGRCLAAYRPEATVENERSEVWIDGAGWTVVCRQITGVLVRRVVCRARPGDQVQAGDRYGVMKFGSRIDLFLPADSRLRVGVGDRVRAGETILAELTAGLEATPVA